MDQDNVARAKAECDLGTCGAVTSMVGSGAGPSTMEIQCRYQHRIVMVALS